MTGIEFVHGYFRPILIPWIEMLKRNHIIFRNAELFLNQSDGRFEVIQEFISRGIVTKECPIDCLVFHILLAGIRGCNLILQPFPHRSDHVVIDVTDVGLRFDGEILHEVHHTILVDVFGRLQKLYKRIHVHVKVKSGRGKQLFPEFPHDRLGTDLRLGPLIHWIQKLIRWDLSVHPVHHTIRTKDEDDEIIQGMGLGTKDLRDGDHDRRGGRWVIQHHPGKVHALHQILHLVDSCRDTDVFRIGFTVDPVV